jgi:hypothetical protein
MVTVDDAHWRKERLSALSDAVGGDAILGRLMGYKDGALVWQMKTGRRPITEKTIAKAETVRHPGLGAAGARAWFSRSPEAAAPPPAEVPSEYRQLLIDLDALGPTQKHEFMQQIHRAAEHVREALHHHERREKVTAAAARKAVGRSVASMTYGDGNRNQAVLPLATVEDPFTAAPSERESALYRRIERASKGDK